MIKSLYLQNYKQFSKKKIEFNKGLNIIIGNNEHGKSSILNGLMDVLFQDATTKSTKYFESIRPINSNINDIKISLVINNNDEQILLERDFQKRINTLKSISSNTDITNDPTEIQNFITNNLGIPNEKVLRNTTFIGQTEIIKLKLNSDLKSELQNISSINSNNTGIQDRIKTLEKELKEINLGLDRPSKNPGKILELNNRIEIVTKEHSEAKIKLEKSLVALKEEKSSGSKLQENEIKIKDLEKTIENHKNHDNFQKRLKEITPSLEQITSQINNIENSKSQLKNLYAQLEVFSPNFKQQNELTKDATRISELKQSLKLYEERLLEANEAKKNEDDLPQLNYLQTSKGELESSIYINLGLIILFASVLGAFIGLFSNTGLVLNISFFTGIIAFLLLIFGNVKKLNNKNTKVETTNTNTTRNEGSEIINIKNKINSINEEINNIITKYNVNDSIEFYTSKAKLVSIHSEIEKLETLINGLLAGKNYEELKDSQLKLINEKNQIDTKLNSEEMKSAKLSPNEYLKVRRELDMLNIEKRKLSKDEAQNNVRANEMGVSSSTVRDLEEELESLNEQKKLLVNRKVVLEQTIRLIKTALKMTSKNLNRALAEMDKSFLSEITANNYSDITITEDYEVKVKDKFNNWLKPEDYLSQGAIEQIYFVLRLLPPRGLEPRSAR